MKRTITLFAASLMTWLGSVTVLGSQNWPQWRGPNFNGTVQAEGLPSDISKDHILWSTPMPGKAGATPVIWEDHVFVTSPDEGGNLLLLALNRQDGSERWRREVGVGDMEKGRNNTAAPSPVTDGNVVVAQFGTGDMAAFDFSGNELWKRNLGREFGRFSLMWIYGSSPLLHEGRLYIQVLQRNPMPRDYPGFDGKTERESFILCVDAKSGKDLWRQVRETDSTLESQESYATPFPYQGKNGLELIIVGGDHVSGHRFSDGSEIWRARLYEKRDDWYRIVTSPVAAQGLILACGPKGQPVVAFRDGGKGNVTNTHVAWRFDEAPTDWSTPLILGDHVFVLDGGKKVLTKLELANGKTVWSGKVPAREVLWSSPTAADGKIFMHSEEGTLIVCSAGNEFKVLGSLTFDGEGPCRGSVAVAQNQIFMRTAKNLYCIGKK
jgi:outer membrane protein assembly factor BamB